MFQDKLRISLSWESDAYNVRKAIDFMKEFFLEFERHSPWQRPFDASGRSARMAYLPIKEDFSDFDQLVFKTMNNGQLKYINGEDSDNYKMTWDSFCALNLRATFSDAVERNIKKNAVVVKFGLKSSKEKKISGVLIEIPQYAPGQENEIWSDSKTIYTLLEFFFDFCIPCRVYIYSSYHSEELFGLWGREDKYELGWLSYTKNKQVKKLLIDDPCVKEYKEGVLIELGNDVSVFTDQEAQKNAIRIRDKLRENGLTDWQE